MTSRRVYVASLSDYNAGRLHGSWIDACQEPEEILEDIAEMLSRSEEPIAEEWAIHDTDNFDGVVIDEYESITVVSAIAQLFEKYPVTRLVSAVLNNGHLDHELRDAQTVEDYHKIFDDYMADHYLGTFESLEDYAIEFLDSTGALDQLPSQYRAYFDFQSFARDLQLGGDIWAARDKTGLLHIFDNTY